MSTLNDWVFIVGSVFLAVVVFFVGLWLRDLVQQWSQDRQRTKHFRENRRVVVGIVGRRSD